MFQVSLFRRAVVLALAAGALCPGPAAASDRFCDPSFENCRSAILSLIANEDVAIDLAFWFMEDARYTTALIKRFKAGVPVRVLVDPRANVKNPLNASRLHQLSQVSPRTKM